MTFMFMLLTQSDIPAKAQRFLYRPETMIMGNGQLM